jgi:acetyl esterase/lipase
MGSLVMVSIWGVFVAVAIWPPFRRGRLGFVVFLLTMTVNEIPLVLLLVFLASLAAMSTPPRGAGAWALILVSAGVTSGLTWLHVRARSTVPRLRDALNHELGQGWRTSVAEVLPTRSPWRDGMLWPFQRRLRGVERIRNVSYGPDRAHRVDIYRRRGDDRDRPVIIQLHGGGFSQGGRSREGVAMLLQLAARGWLCLSVDYRIGTAGEFPNPLVDTKRAIVWIRDHAGEYAADAAHVYLLGQSAGGHLAISAALTGGDPRFQPGFESSNTEVAGAVALYGYLGPLTPDPASSPAALARGDAPPLLIIHGSLDTMVPPEGPRSVASILRSSSRSPVVYAEIPGMQHDHDFFGSVRARLIADEVEAFLCWARSQPV